MCKRVTYSHTRPTKTSGNKQPCPETGNTHTYACTHRHMHTQTHARALFLLHTHIHTHTHTYTHTNLCTFTQADENESVDAALILQRLTSNFPSAFLLRSPSASVHLDQICGFTCLVMQRACRIEDVSWHEALDHLLELWSGLCNNLCFADDGKAMLAALSTYTAKIFRYVSAYIHT